MLSSQAYFKENAHHFQNQLFSILPNFGKEIRSSEFNRINKMTLRFHYACVSLHFGRSIYFILKVESSDNHQVFAGILKKIKINFTLSDLLHVNISSSGI